MISVPEAAFHWTTTDELRAAIQSCLQQDEAYERRKAAWPTAISEHVYRADARASERLYDFLAEYDILTPARRAPRRSAAGR